MTPTTDFEKAIAPYPALVRTYEDSLKAIASVDAKMTDEEVESFLSENCRAYFFWHHLSVEREASDRERRSLDDSPIVPFHLSSIQLKLLDTFERRMLDGRKFQQAVMKCRRARVSTLYLAIGYHLIRFGQNKKGLVFADILDTSRRLRRILDIFYEGDTLPGKPELGRKTLGEGLYLHHSGEDKSVTARNSFILLGSGEQKNPGIAGGLDFFVWSEASLTADATRNWTTISPALKGAFFIVFESTPSLTGQDEVVFPKFEHPTSDCDAHFFSWMDVEEYSLEDEEQERNFVPFEDHVLYGKERDIMASYGATVRQMLWRRFKLDELRNANAFRQVFPISKEEAFYSGAGLFFHKDLIAGTKPPAEDKTKSTNVMLCDQGAGGFSCMPTDTGIWQMWRQPDPTCNYMVVGDTSEGKTADPEARDPDYCVGIVFELRGPMVEEVAFLRDRIPAEIFGDQLYAAARFYNDAFIVPERNGPGLAALARITPNYNNIYRQHRMQGGTFQQTADLGFYSSTLTKPHALSCLLTKLRAREILLRSDIIRVELSKFVQNGVRYGSSAGFHDDCVTCLWLMAVALSQMPSLTQERNTQSLTGGPGRCYKPIIQRESSATD